MNLIRWEPLGGHFHLRDTMDRVFDQVAQAGPWLTLADGPAARIPLEIYEQDDAIVLRAALTGLRPEDVEITVTGDTVVLKGELTPPAGIAPEHYLLQEWRYGKFARSVTLPVACQMDKAEADFDRGVLTLRIPKAEAVRSRTIQVKSPVLSA